MKKVIIFSVVFFTVFVSFGQLDIKSVSEYGNYRTVYTVTYFGSNMGEVRYISDIGFVMFGVTDNRFEESMASIFLGEDKGSAVKSIVDLRRFYDSAEDGEYIVDGFKCKTRIIISSYMGTKGIQIKSDGVAGVSGIPSWFCIKEKHYNGVIEAIKTFSE